VHVFVLVYVIVCECDGCVIVSINVVDFFKKSLVSIDGMPCYFSDPSRPMCTFTQLPVYGYRHCAPMVLEGLCLLFSE